MFSVGRRLDGDRFSAGMSEDVPSVARLGGGHRRVIKEGLVIPVSRSLAGRLWSRALISTNRFLIRASRAPQPPLPPRINTHGCVHICTNQTVHQFPNLHLL